MKTLQRSTVTKVLTPAFAAAILGLGLFSTASAADMLTSQLDFGARGINVTNLQSFLAETPSIYPQGLVTGYYGSLTVQAVKNFQAVYGFDQVGRVGPQTLAKINSLIANGGSVSADVSGPALYSVAQNIGQTYNTFSWATNENASARVFYSTSPVQFNEGDITSAGFGARTGQVASTDSNFRTTHSVSVMNLQPNTIYYYTLVSTDASGNVSVFGPNNTFRTNQ
ncbi:MAG: peptidoglycan-binding protein [Candidatus Paceibacterota bacterium]